MQYNPQIEIDFSLINDDGSESDMTINLFDGPAGDYSQLRHHEGWDPLKVDINVNKSLGGTQDRARITIHNTPYIEKFYLDYQAELEKIRIQKWRVRIWAWYSDNLTLTPRPAMPPSFVGDITEDFSVVPEDITDASIQLECMGHGWLSRSGKMKKTWVAGTTYREIVQDLFENMLSKGYGREQRGDTPKYVIKADARLGKTLKRGFSKNRNPCEVMNDICRELDFVWGIHNNIPYITPRDKAFNTLLEDYPTSSALPPTALTNSHETGMSSLINFGKYSYSLSSLYDSGFMPGRYINTRQDPQINIGVFTGSVDGRINEISANLSNYGEGHQIDITCQYVKGRDVILPPKRADNSGLRNE